MRYSACALGLLLLVCLVYANSMPGAFHYDDYPLMLENPDVAGSDFRYSMFLDQYGGRPLTLWTFHVNSRLGGEEPAGYHVFNLALHALSVILLFLLLAREIGRSGLALGAAAIFAVHPLQTQAVNYIWSRSVLLMAVFVLAALLVARTRPWVALLLFQLAIWSRAEALALVPLLWLLNRRSRSALLILLGANLAALFWGLLRHDPAEVAWNHEGWAHYWLQAPAVFWEYVSRMLWPVDLSIFHGPLVFNGVHLAFSATALLAGLVAAIMLLRRGQYRTESWGFLWMILFLAPSLLMPNTEALSESRSYLALAGFSVILASVVTRFLSLGQRTPFPVHWRRAMTLVILLPISIALILHTLDRNQIWQDDVALWREAVKRSPSQTLPWYNLGVALARQGDIEEASAAFTEALRLNPQDDMGYAGLGYCAESRGHWLQAVDLYGRALTLNPANSYAKDAYARSQVNLGAR